MQGYIFWITPTVSMPPTITISPKTCAPRSHPACLSLCRSDTETASRSAWWQECITLPRPSASRALRGCAPNGFAYQRKCFPFAFGCTSKRFAPWARRCAACCPRPPCPKWWIITAPQTAWIRRASISIQTPLPCLFSTTSVHAETSACTLCAHALAQEWARLLLPYQTRALFKSTPRKSRARTAFSPRFIR